MRIKNYIFLTEEGVTFQPDSELIEPDIENLQVIGFACGRNSKEAFQQLIEQNSYLLDTSFEEIFSYELSKSYDKTKVYYSLSKNKQ